MPPSCCTETQAGQSTTATWVLDKTDADNHKFLMKIDGVTVGFIDNTGFNDGAP